MHQQFDLVDQLSALNNVLAGRLGDWGLLESLWSLVRPRERTRALRALERVGIRDRAEIKTAHLSGGEQQRVALARLLLQNPRILLADEPVASVDPARAEDLLQMLQNITDEENLTLIVSLHSVELALRYFPRIVAMRDGHVLYDQPAETIDDQDLEELYALRERDRLEETPAP
jgi:phosphonate transport system ATP-binding protein